MRCLSVRCASLMGMIYSFRYFISAKGNLGYNSKTFSSRIHSSTQSHLHLFIIASYLHQRQQLSSQTRIFRALLEMFLLFWWITFNTSHINTTDSHILNSFLWLPTTVYLCFAYISGVLLITSECKLEWMRCNLQHSGTFCLDASVKTTTELSFFFG